MPGRRVSPFWSAVARLAAYRPRLVLAVAVALAAASVAFAFARLGFQPNRNDLLSTDLEWNQRAISWWREFPDMTGFVVAVDAFAGGPAAGDAESSRGAAERFVDALGPRLEASPWVERAWWGAPSASFSAKTARLGSIDDLNDALDGALRAAPVLSAASFTEAVDLAADRLRARPGVAIDAEAALRDLDEFAAFLDAAARTARAPSDRPSPLASRAEPEPGWTYLTNDARDLYFVRVQPVLDRDALNAHEPSIDAIRSAVRETLAEHPGVDAGLTGIDVLEADETAVAVRDSAISSALALAAITALLVAAFHTARAPLLCMAALLVGIAWSFGYLTLAVGHLQILSVVFVVILLGLGIDSAIHIATALEEVRRDHPDGRDAFDAALAEALSAAGPGIVIGAVTTAAAFGVTTFTDFRGVAELGLIASGGVLLCTLATLTVFPALLALLSHDHQHVPHLDDRRVHVFRPSWLTPVIARPRLTLWTALVLVAVAAPGVVGTRFSNDLMALQPRGVESARWQRAIAERTEGGVYFAASIAPSAEAARARADALRALPTVGRVAGAGLLAPEAWPAKSLLIADARAALAPTLAPALRAEAAPLDAGALAARCAAIALGADSAAGSAPPEIAGALSRVASSARALSDALATAPDEGARAVSEGFAEFKRAAAERIDALLDPAPLAPEDLPGALIAPYVAEVDGDRRYAVEIYPRLPADGSVAGPLDPRFLGLFVRDVRSVDPEATGVIMQVAYSGALIRRSFVLAGTAASIAVLGILLIAFRSFADALMCMLPLAVGFALTFGLMNALDMPVNLANIIVLPLMFGVGVDAGVHVLHRFRQHPGDWPPGLTAGTGKGVTLTAATTIAGFASMMIASHRGIAGLGFVLSVGIALTLLTCWTVLPSWLALRAERRARRRERNGIAP